MARPLWFSLLVVVLAPVASQGGTALRAAEKERGQPELPMRATLRLGSPHLRLGESVDTFVVLDGGKRLAALCPRAITVWDLGSGLVVDSCELAPASWDGPLRKPFIAYPRGWHLAATADGTALFVVRAWSASLYQLPLTTGKVTPLPAPPPQDSILAAVPTGQGGAILVVTGHGSFLEWRPGDDKWTALKGPAIPEPPFVVAGGGVVAILEKENRIRLWGAAQGKELGVQEGVRIKAVGVSGDGKRFAAAAENPKPRALPFVEVRTIPGRERVSSWEVRTLPTVVALSADGTRAAVTFSNFFRKEVEVYEVVTGKLLKILQVPERGVQHLVFLPNGDLVTAGYAGVIQVWDITSGKPRHPQAGHLGPVRCIIRTPATGWITAGADGTVIRWNAEGQEVCRFVGHTGAVTGLALSKDGKTLYTSGIDCTVREWDAKTGKERRFCLVVTQLLQIVTSLAISPDGKHLAVTVRDGELRVLETRELTVVKDFQPKPPTPGAATTAVAFASDDQIVSRDTRGGVRVWSLSGKGEVRQLDVLSKQESACLAISPEGKTVVAPFGRLGDKPAIEYVLPATELGVWDIESGKLLDRIKTDTKEGLTAVCYLPGGKAVAVGDAAGTVWVVDLEKKTARHVFKGHRGPVLCLTPSPDGKTLTSGGADTTAIVWKLE